MVVDGRKSTLSDDLVVGIDVGTGGVRAVAVTMAGQVVAMATRSLAAFDTSLPSGWHEQDPRSWWSATKDCLQQVVCRLGKRRQAVGAVAVDATSGTLTCLSDKGEPIRPALMYNDSRASSEANDLNELAVDHCHRHGYRFASSFAVAKIAWLLRNEPSCVERTRWFCHQTDYIVGCLTGDFGVSDYSNALKTGYDLLEDCWPAWVDAFDGIRDKLPRVVPPGQRVGLLSAAAASELGLSPATAVVSGATDGTAGFLASGASCPGDDNTTLGTTLVFKRLVDRPTMDENGLIYSHKLPGGYWLPGAASNTGGEWITRYFANEDPAKLDRAAVPLLPSALVAYPLARTGERFPFAVADAQGFCLPPPNDPLQRYAACLQGVAFTERLAYEILDRATGSSDGDVYATGAAARSDLWLQVRADVTGRTVIRSVYPDAAFGSAVLAVVGLHGEDLWTVATNMVRVERSFTPSDQHAFVYGEWYEKFIWLLDQRGYLPEVKT